MMNQLEFSLMKQYFKPSVPKRVRRAAALLWQKGLMDDLKVTEEDIKTQIFLKATNFGE